MSKKKMRCPFSPCPHLIPAAGVGFRSHVVSAHGENAYKEYMEHKQAPAPVAAVPSGNGNGKLHASIEGRGQMATECPHCGGAILLLPAVVESGRLNATISTQTGVELRKRN